MDKYKPVLFFGAAVLVASITAILAYNWLQGKSAVKDISAQTQQVVVSTASLPWGTVLNRQMIKTVPFLKGSLPQHEFFSDVSLLEGRVLINPVSANEPILKSRLAPDTLPGGGVAAVVDPAKRAMAVKVDKVIGVSGFIGPGNRVDVLVTIKKGDANKGENITKIVLQNILVLATGTELQPKDNKEKPSQVDVITLELTPEEAEKLAMATTEGKIQLAMRNYKNTDEVKTNGVTVSALLSVQGPVKPSVTKWRPPANQNRNTVQLIKGSTVSEIKF